MAQNICPSCGAAYNGKRCRSCFYEPCREEIVHSHSTHKGAPPVRKTPTRKKHPFAGFLILLALIYSLMPLLRTWGLDLEAREEAARTPEPVLQPEEMVIFHQEDGITIFTSTEDFSHPADQFCLYVQNDSDRNVTASAGEFLVNGISVIGASLVCPARAGETGKGWLELDSRELEALGIGQIKTLSFTLTILRQDGRIGFTTDEILLIAEGADIL